MQSSIVVIGSSNTDMVIKADHLPLPGETVLGGTFLLNPGGKGANQAVAAARLESLVCFITKTGNDAFGKENIALFQQEGIDTGYALVDEQLPSGVALITVDKKGENCIVVASGANASLLPADLLPAREKIVSASVLVLQLEIPLETVEYAAAFAAGAGVQVILNPAPARALPDSLLQYISILTPNETEAELLTGIAIHDIASAEQAAKLLQQKGVATVLITLGDKGALLVTAGTVTHIPSFAVQAVDTTAAGDVFNGALAVAVAQNTALPDAVLFATKAAAISVTRMGAQSSAPYLHEVNAFQTGESNYST